MTALQEQILILLKELDKLCDLQNIPYYLYADTTLSATVNEGFFSTDNTASIMMKTEDAQKLKKLLITDTIINREIQDGGGLYSSHIRYVNTLYVNVYITIYELEVIDTRDGNTFDMTYRVKDINPEEVINPLNYPIVLSHELLKGKNEIKFEDTDLPVVQNIDSFLNCILGEDWKKISEVPLNIQDDLIYNQTVKRPFSKRENRVKSKYKAKWVKSISKSNERFREITCQKYQLTIMKLFMEAQQEIKNRGLSIRKLFDEECYSDIAALYSYYVAEQCNPYIVLFTEKLPIDDETLYYLVYSLYKLGESYTVKELMKIRCKTEMDDRLKEIDRLIG